MRKRLPSLGPLGWGLVVFLMMSLVATSASQVNGGAVPIDSDDIGGVVAGARGPEAGGSGVAGNPHPPPKISPTRRPPPPRPPPAAPPPGSQP